MFINRKSVNCHASLNTMHFLYFHAFNTMLCAVCEISFAIECTNKAPWVRNAWVLLSGKSLSLHEGFWHIVESIECKSTSSIQTVQVGKVTLLPQCCSFIFIHRLWYKFAPKKTLIMFNIGSIAYICEHTYECACVCVRCAFRLA